MQCGSDEYTQNKIYGDVGHKCSYLYVQYTRYDRKVLRQLL
jgi:hypothetical protein